MSEFLAEASVLIRPDTSKFRAELETELLAIMRSARVPPITIPVAAVGGGLAAATAASESLIASNERAQASVLGLAAAAEVETSAFGKQAIVLESQQVLGARAAQAAITQAQAESLLASVQSAITGATEAGALSTTHLAGARAVLRANTAAVVASEHALDAALLTEDAALIDAALNTEALAVADRLLASENVKLAISQKEVAAGAAEQAAAQSQLRRGFFATALAALGARGATLAAGSEFLIGAAAATVFFKSVQSAADLQEQMVKLQAATHASSSEIAAAGKEARALGEDLRLPGVSAGEAATAITNLATSGISVQNSLRAARGVLELTTAGEIDLASASQIAANALKVFNLSGSETSHIADLLVGAAERSQSSVSDLASGLANVAPVAHALGLTIDDIISLLSALSAGGLQGARGGTALRFALQSLLKPSKAASDEIKALHLNLSSLQGDPAVFDRVAEATRGLDRTARQNIATVIFGRRGFQAYAAATAESAVRLREAAAAQDEQGLAAQRAQARARGLSGEIRTLGQEFGALGFDLGQLVVPPLEIFGSVLIGVLGTAIKFIDVTQSLAGRLVDLGKGAEGLAVSLLKPVQKIPLLGTLLDEATRHASVAGRALGFVFDPLGTSIDIAQRALGSGSEKIASDSEKIVASVNKIIEAGRKKGGVEGIQEITQGLDRLIAGLQEAGPRGRAFAKVLQDIRDELQRTGKIPTTVSLQVLLDLVGLKAQTHDVGVQAQDELRRGIQDFMDAHPVDVTAKVQIHAEALDTKIAIAQATGTQGQQLALLRQQLAQRRAFLERLIGEESVPRTPKQQARFADLEQRAAANVKSAQDAITSIVSQQASDAQQAAQKQKQARDKADQAILDSIGGEEQRRQNALTRAQATAGLGDDIQKEIALRNFYRRKRDEVRKTVQDAKAKADEIRTLSQALFNINQQIRQDEKARQEQIRQQRQAAADTRLQILQTEIATAQITGNRAVQRRLLNAEIAELENQIRGAKRGSLKRAQLLQELRQAQKDLNDLKTQTDKNAGAAKALQQAEFAFLQTQAGFAANLIGNLIPGGLTGLVGGITAGGIRAQISPNLPIRQQPGAGGFPPGEKGATPASQVGHAFTQALAQRDRGVTSGQGNTQIELLRRLLAAVNRLNRSADHPEAKQQRRTGAAIMDYHGESAGM